MLKVLDQAKTNDGFIYLIDAQFEYFSCPIIFASDLNKSQVEDMLHSFELEELSLLSNPYHAPVGSHVAKHLLIDTTKQFEELPEVVAYKEKQDILKSLGQSRKPKARARAM